MSDAIFLLDTNVFIEAQQRYYGLDLCPGFWDALRHFCGEGRILSLDRVRDEISDREDELTTWAKDAAAELFAGSTAAPVLAKYREIMTSVNAGRVRTPPRRNSPMARMAG